MTLQECFDILSANPAIIVFYYCAVPLTAILAGELDRGEGHLSPWKYLYSTLVYLATVPGIFAVTLIIYLFLFEHMSIMEFDIYTQLLPIVSMIVTLWIVKKNVELDLIPGFDKLSTLMFIILIIFMAMWILNKMRFVVFSHLPIYWVVIIFIVIMIALRYGIRRLSN
jgi:hypothetical protein